MPSSAPDRLDEALALLHNGNYRNGITILEEITRTASPQAVVCFNLGLAYSEIHQFPEAVIALKRSIDLDAENASAWVALGTAYARMTNVVEAREAFEQALRLKPDDPLALLNLAATLMMQGDFPGAVEAARRSHSAQPDNERALWALAEATFGLAFEPRGEEAKVQLLSEASIAYKLYLARYPNSPMVEQAEKALTSISEASLRSRGIGAGGFRPDVYEYIIHALRLFEQIGAARRNQVVLEIAKVGAEGFDINDPARRHAIKGLPGDYTGLQLVSFMYAGMQLVDPNVHTGVDFSREYASALQMLGRKP